MLISFFQQPWVAALVNGDGELHCGASVISETLLLTAGHCVRLRVQLVNYKAVFAVNDIVEWKEGKGEERSFDRQDIILHDDYKVRFLNYLYQKILGYFCGLITTICTNLHCFVPFLVPIYKKRNMYML